MKPILTFLIILLFHSSCITIKDKSQIAALHKIVLYQQGKESLIGSEPQSIEIIDDEFSIRFYNKKYDPEKEKFYAAQIAALTDERAFQQIFIGFSLLF